MNEIKNYDLSKGHSKRANVIFSDSENQDTKKIYFAFGFSTQSVSDFEQIAFEKNENSTCNIFWNSSNSIIWIRWKKLIKNLLKT